DETRVLVGEVGTALVTARRRGQTWYVGGMTAKHPREFSFPLSFLGSKRYTAKVWMDSADSVDDPNRLQAETLLAVSRDVLRVRTTIDGGFVAILTPNGR